LKKASEESDEETMEVDKPAPTSNYLGSENEPRISFFQVAENFSSSADETPCSGTLEVERYLPLNPSRGNPKSIGRAATQLHL